MSSELILRAENVGLSYRQRVGMLRYESFWALQDVSFDLFEGETLGVIGNNGAGKSTLLRMIAGIVDPDRGTLERRKPLNASLLALNVGFKPELSGRDNVIIGGLLLGMSRDELRRRMDEIREFSDLGDFFERPVGTYSTGMRARLGFAVAIHADPDILLIDEILGVGDQTFREKSHAAMKAKIKQGKTVILVSHSMEAIRDLCHRVLWIERGKLVLCGDTPKVVETYHEAVRIAVRDKQKADRERKAALGLAEAKG
ncbi:ABC transporter ATP-binding protein [Pseudomonas sp. ZM23]|uniref:ABC transporter ATP-binding protein n=1 Tax=Pseudomonas triclosanedens TaxID=2961893 RepID=A0ABY7A001_9PSED|nr:ABC transporter ATP-binding protein [Pseudomonas triclosanedens]MCP8462392.1 ABC transporter ATP-binding protein [Pseudomonas triclosanedens]MCP8468030.1 ABC transporter ATP-binding protein [Pseudomonas triclosanedens]MCP8474789.1 ABC transporter ATP-binding protein [Pseudomonas triclosanedens]WAI49585.1 ABC transporter ATP-binding protein [Pseudomonas triclosanedens]